MHICIRCKAKFRNGLQFEQHRCKDMRSLEDLPTDLLEKLARKEMTEIQVWAEFDAR